MYTKGPWITKEGMVYAEIYGNGETIANVNTEANAHLIAAAPTMDIAIRSMLVNINLAIKSGSIDSGYLRLAIEAGETAITTTEKGE